MASRFILPFADVGDGITPSDGALLEFFATGTSNQLDTFTNEALTVANTNPVVADGNGVFPDIWLPEGTRYKVTLDDKNIVQKFEADPVIGGASANSSARDFGTVALMVADTELKLGQFATFESYTTNGDGGGNRGIVVAAATGTADGGSFIDLPNTTPALQWQGLFPGGIINVQQFGATGDGSTDDSSEIQAAIDFWKTKLSGESVDGFTEYGATLVFGGDGDRYLHNTSLDFASIRSKGARVVFDGSALLSNCTGKAAVDCTNSRYMQWDNLQIVGNASNVPSIGVLLARNSGGGNSDNYIFKNLKIQGHFSTAGLYNYASEVNTFYSPLIWNYSSASGSWDLVITRSNVLSVTSDYETVGTVEASTNDNFFYGCDFRKLNDGHNILLDAVRNVRMQGFCAYGGTFPSARDYHVLANTESTQRSTQIELDVHFESPSVVTNSIFQYEFTTNNNSIFGLEIKDFETQALSFVRFKGAIQGVSGLKLTGFMSATAKPFSADGTVNVFVRQAEILNYSIVAAADSIDLDVLGTTGQFLGEIRTFDPADVKNTNNVTLTTAQILTSVRDISYEGRDLTTIASGVLTLGSNYIDIKGEGAASDTLDTMAGTFFDGEVITIVNTDAADVITITHDTGADGFFNKSAASVVLNPKDIVRYKYIANLIRWLEI